LEEDKLLKENCKKLNDKQMEKLFIGRTQKAINHRRQRLGLSNKRTPKSSMKSWTKKEDQIIINNYRKISYEEMSKLLPGRTTTSIEIRRQTIKDSINNLILRKSSGKKWSKEEDVFIVESYGKLTYEEMAKILENRTSRSIEARCQKLGFDRDPNLIKRKNRLYTVNKRFFEVPTIINSYIAGFIAADGNLGKDSHYLSITLQPKDSHILQEFANHFDYDGFIRTYKYKNGYYDNLNICGIEEWYVDLERNFNIVPAKTFILKPPNLTDEKHIKAYIRGYIDGDGSIIYSNKGKGIKSWDVGVSGTEQVLTYIKMNFDKWVPNAYHNRLAEVKLYGDSKTYSYKVSGRRAEYILKILLEVETLFLKRKWQPFIDYLNNQ
jgi:hypothetical protein